jgi:mannose-1-phosphate guanylyltransferase/mannose-6-phosphate isomerase
MSLIVPVILSGGMGTRLWPVSRTDNPKQFGRLFGRESLLQATVSRLAGLNAAAPIVVCNRSHADLVAQQLAAVGVTPQAVLLEPVGRNTAPAVAVAAGYLQQHLADPNAVMLVLPADHMIAHPAAFVAAVQTAAGAAEADYLATFGVVPRTPETGYGYLKQGEPRQGCFAVDAFVEKPDLATAERYLASGQYLWNSGMFAFKPGVFLNELQRLEPDMAWHAAQALAGAVDNGSALELDSAAFAACPGNSIDYAVMERTDKAVLVPLDAGWSDVGSWSAVADLGAPDGDGNSCAGDVLLHDCNNSHFHSSGRLIAGVGVQDHIVVETPDAVLVVHRDRAQDVKSLVDELKRRQRRELHGFANEGTDEP